MAIVLNNGELDTLIERVLRAARIPGAAIAVVADGGIAFAKGYGYRDVEAKLPVTADTVYPIASTTKAINATLLGMLVDEGRLAWDLPVQDYLPKFRLRDPVVSTRVTLRDLLVMRTGLPRHDWMWIENPISRPELLERLRYLELSADFRSCFQYNNMTATVAGHIAEVITGQSWEEMAQRKVFSPLQMTCTVFTQPIAGNVSLSYHENTNREILLTKRLAGAVTAPSGGAIHSTVIDMARWIAFNLSGGETEEGIRLIKQDTLAQIHSPQMIAGGHPSAPTPGASYAMGWFVDTYNGSKRISHGGYLHDINSDVMLFPEHGIGLVSFINFGFPKLASVINQHVFDSLMGFRSPHTFEDKLAEYEQRIGHTRMRNASVARVSNTSPSHPLSDYPGVYTHPGYGRVEIQLRGADLLFQRGSLVLQLQHWHYDAWIARDSGMFFIDVPHAFDAASRFLFETNADGEIAAFSIGLEPAVAPIRFARQQVVQG